MSLNVVTATDDFDSNDEPECPVCRTSLDPRFRLPGEKPTIVPACGHPLHYECFKSVYGDPAHRSSNKGVCGVCRATMVVHVLGGSPNSAMHQMAQHPSMGSMPPAMTSSRSRTSNKLAALLRGGTTTQPPSAHASPNPNRTARPLPASANRSPNPATTPYMQPTSPNTLLRSPIPAPSIEQDPNADDPLLPQEANHPADIPSQSPSAPSYNNRQSGPHSPYHAGTRTSIATSRSGSISTIPSHPNSSSSNAIITPTIEIIPEFHHLTLPSAEQVAQDPSAASRQMFTMLIHVGLQSRTGPSDLLKTTSLIDDRESPRSPPTATYLQSQTDLPSGDPRAYDARNKRGFQRLPIAPAQPLPDQDALVQNLLDKVSDWKGDDLRSYGPVILFDRLYIKRQEKRKELHVYLFQNALALFSESRMPDTQSPTLPHTEQALRSTVQYRLRGRIFVDNINDVQDVSQPDKGYWSCRLQSDTQEFDQFVISFISQPSLEKWKAGLRQCIQIAKQEDPSLQQSTASDYVHDDAGSQGDYEASSPHPQPPLLQRQLSHKSTAEQSITSYQPKYRHKPAPVLAEFPHVPIDLILILSVPGNTQIAAAALKARLIKTSLDFVRSSMGRRDRLSIVTYSVGMGGALRRTPFINIGTDSGQSRLKEFIEAILHPQDESSDAYTVPASVDENTDVVTAVNLALDNILTRKAKNPLCGAILVSDSPEATHRSQMDLVLVRAEAAKVPIHSCGWGKLHDPASLWLISSQTSGTYTFIKEWYHLRDCLAGCIGGLFAIALTDMKLSLSVSDKNRFRVRKISPATGCNVSADGTHADLNLNEIRYGERREVLVEMEMIIPEGHLSSRAATANHRIKNASATDAFVRSMGLALPDLAMPSLIESTVHTMMDEVPVFELDTSYSDPFAGKNISRLADPVLSTVEIHPSPASDGRRPTKVPQSDLTIIKRRIELLSSDMITRALLSISRHEYEQAIRLLEDTQRVIRSVMKGLDGGKNAGARRERQKVTNRIVFDAILQDLQEVREAIDDEDETFDIEQRNFGAQQAMILRDQKAWTPRSAIESIFWTIDNSRAIFQKSAQYSREI